MSNRIRRVEVRERSLDPAQSELWVSVHPERQTDTTEVHGRLLGPRCPYATTVEVAYPLRPFARTPEGLSGIVRRVVVPEASLWEPECPFLYEGPVELWEDGQAVDRVQLSRGLRTLQFSPRGLRVNDRLLPLRGRAVQAPTEADARGFRANGINLLVAPARAETAPIWTAADRWGFLLLGMLSSDSDCLARAASLADHASALGWVIEQDDLNDPRAREAIDMWLQEHPQLRVGARLTSAVETVLPARVRFVVQNDAMLQAGELGLPTIVWRANGAAPDKNGWQTPAEHGVIGWIQA